ncbi:MAG: HutD family protein [Burkholderiales bacterium]|nr:HutD family protein [Burkholderiales bacterium]
MRKWTPENYQVMPWKNGGGSTTELAIFPPGAGLDNFVWRLSTAQVDVDGPFSHFPQIDRTLAILKGDGLVLHSGGEQQRPKEIFLQQDSPPYIFAGETSIRAELTGGTVIDLNMMTRRDVCTHFMQRLRGGQHFVEAHDAQQLLLYCASGGATLHNGERMQENDLCLFEESREHAGIRLELSADDEAVLYLIRVHFLNVGDS